MALSALGTALLFTACAQLPGSLAPSWLRQNRTAYRTIWPQGWGFFASAANNPSISVFPVAADGRVSGSVINAFGSSDDLWGMDRRSQATLGEALALASQVPGKSWVPCGAPSVQSCLGAASPISLINNYQPALLCGLNLFVAQQYPTDPVSPARPVSESTILAVVSCPH